MAEFISHDFGPGTRYVKPLANMADLEEEAHILQQEYDWLLREEVHSVLSNLHDILLECCKRFPIAVPVGNSRSSSHSKDHPLKADKFVLTSPNTAEHVKCVVTLYGDNICQADVTLKMHKNNNIIYRTTIQNESPWKLQQVQDAGNHLCQALQMIDSKDFDHEFKSGQEVLSLLKNIMTCLNRGRSCLIIPKKRTIEELQSSRNMKLLQPALPNDMVVSFYIQSHKLVFAAYHTQKNHHGSARFDVYQSDCSVPWLNEVLVLFTVALQLCQQIKDKVSVFSQYKDCNFDNLDRTELI